MSSSGGCPHSPEVTVPLLYVCQSAFDNVGTLCKPLWNSVGGQCGAEAAKPDAGPEGNSITTPKLVWWGRVSRRELNFSVVECGEPDYLIALMYPYISHERT